MARNFYLAITNSYVYLPRDFECIQVGNVITYTNMLTEHIRDFAKCHQALFHVPHVGLGTRLTYVVEIDVLYLE